MQLHSKEHDATWTDGQRQSNLDHVVAAGAVQLAELGVRPDGTPFMVRVEGLQQLTGNARKTFIEMVSDHCALFCQVS